MIKVNLITVGKIREKFINDGISEYSKRLKKYCEFNIIEIKEETLGKESPSEIGDALIREGDAIIKAIRGDYYVFAIEGKEYGSPEFAKLISNSVDKGGEINFVIGSSYGVVERVKSGAKGKISFSRFTLPHALFRLCACEQVYRAFTIIAGAMYHK